MIKLRLLIWKDYPGLSEQVQYNHVLIREKQEGQSQEKDAMIESDAVVM